MTRLPVVQAPDRVLNRISKPVTYKEKNLRRLLLDMAETLRLHHDPPGVGLAAPQIGVSLRIFMAVLGTSGTEEDLHRGQIKVFINPEIISILGDSGITRAGRQTAEGCLSLKHYYGQVNRGTQVKVKYQTIDLKILTKTPDHDWKKNIQQQTTDFYGFEARIMQHETDHLNGLLFTSRVLEQNGKLYQVVHQKGKDIWEEIDLKNI
jgi:peptide deformylase